MTASGKAIKTVGDPILGSSAPSGAALGGLRRVIKVGAGTGSYEPVDREVVAVEPSEQMIIQRRRGAAPVIQAMAEALPCRTMSFDVSMAILTVHHWTNRTQGLAELCRVAPRRAVLTFDPAVHNQFWLI